MSQGPLITCKNLTFSYGTHSLFNNISFKVERPGFHSIFGRSGTGKSTLANILARRINDAIYTQLDVPSRIMYCQSSEQLPPWSTVKAHLSSITPFGTCQSVDKLLDIFRLPIDLLDRYPSELSTGETRRINVLRYLLQDFEMLILDEALNNVDEPTRLEILTYMKSLYSSSSGASLFYISHDIGDVVSLSDTIIHIRKVDNEAELTLLYGLNSYDADAVVQNGATQSLIRKLKQ
jgi:ABC-type multidrug transport system ATPase subunit